MQKHVIITGASRGIGFETAKYLASKNTLVTAIARSVSGLRELKAFNNENIFTLQLDITDPKSSHAIINHLNKSELYINGILHNAGLLINKPFMELSDADWESQFRVNLLSPARLTRNLLDRFSDNSHILNIGSMGGYQGSSKFSGLSAYSATKGGLGILTECLAAELESKNISANCLCLGAVQTEMLEQAFPGFKAPIQANSMAEYIGDFLLYGHKFYNGQILPVTIGNPT
ncbi:MAG: SDR family oxidoreductase [Balneolaceae bacterium]|nr:MAG: SDR family oxidoreductase [Balneolaceae bacterium]